FPSKGEIEDLANCPRRDQSVAHLDRQDLPCVSTWRRNQVYAVHRCRRYVQPCNVCPYCGGVFSLSPKKACRCCNDVGSLEHTGSARVCRHADVLENACCSKEIGLVSETETNRTQVDVGHCNRRRAECATQQHHVGAFIGTDLRRNIVKDGFVFG